MAAPFANTFDDRDRQGKALAQWERQRKLWARLEENLAAQVGKGSAQETLPGKVHHFRQRLEEATVLDASVPPEDKTGHHAWEMNLRSYGLNATGREGGGVRYVQLGQPYPYPLYVPVRDGVTTNPESNSLMRVIPDEPIADRRKPVAASPFFRQRLHEYRSHIRRVFSHFVPNPSSLALEGHAPPATDDRAAADGAASEAARQPVVFYPAPEEPAPVPADAESASGQTRSRASSMVTAASPNTRASVASEAASLSNTTFMNSSFASANLPGGRDRAPKSGPVLVMSAASVCATVAPGELAQLSLSAQNSGTTAIFYNWAVRERDPVPHLSGRCTPAFDLADTNSGVLLPGDAKVFTFSYRPLLPGSYSQSIEMHTVPAGRDRILVHLQVFAVAEMTNPAAAAALDKDLERRGIAVAARAMLTGPLQREAGDAMLTSEYRRTHAALTTAAAAPAAAAAATQATRAEQWAALNSVSTGALPSAINHYHVEGKPAKEGPRSTSALDHAPPPPPLEAPRSVPELPIPFNRAVFEALSQLSASVGGFVGVCAAVAAAPKALKDGAGALAAAAESAPGRPLSGGASPSPPRRSLHARASIALPSPPPPTDTVAVKERGAAAAVAVFVEKEASVSPPPPWDGSLRTLLEGIALVRDGPTRNRCAAAAMLLVELALCAENEHDVMATLVARHAAAAAADDAAADIDAYAAGTAAELADGKTFRRAAVDPKDKSRGGAAKKERGAKERGGRPGSAGPELRGVDDGGAGRLPTQHAFLHAGAAAIAGPAFHAAVRARSEAAAALIATVCGQPIVSASAPRLDVVRRLVTAREADIDAIVEVVKRKR